MVNSSSVNLIIDGNDVLTVTKGFCYKNRSMDSFEAQGLKCLTNLQLAMLHSI